jgi:hypothetical protein
MNFNSRGDFDNDIALFVLVTGSLLKRRQLLLLHFPSKFNCFDFGLVCCIFIAVNCEHFVFLFILSSVCDVFTRFGLDFN